MTFNIIFVDIFLNDNKEKIIVPIALHLWTWGVKLSSSSRQNVWTFFCKKFFLQCLGYGVWVTKGAGVLVGGVILV